MIYEETTLDRAFDRFVEFLLFFAIPLGSTYLFGAFAYLGATDPDYGIGHHDTIFSLFFSVVFAIMFVVFLVSYIQEVVESKSKPPA